MALKKKKSEARNFSRKRRQKKEHQLCDTASSKSMYLSAAKLGLWVTDGLTLSGSWVTSRNKEGGGHRDKANRQKECLEEQAPYLWGAPPGDTPEKDFDPIDHSASINAPAAAPPQGLALDIKPSR